MTTKEPISQSQRVFVPHKSNAKPSFQTFSKQSTATTTASGTSQYLPQSSSSQTTLAKSSDYSLRSGHKTPAVISKPQNTHPPVKISSSTTSSAISAGVSTMSALSKSTSSASINRTSPPSVTRVVYSTNPAINPSASNKPIPSSNKFVPFKSETKPSVANSSTVNVAPINSLHTSSHSTTGAKSSTVNVTPINSINTSSQIATNPAINPSASNTSIPSSNKFVPFKSETKPSGANNSTANVVPRNSLNTSSQRTTGANCSTANVAPISSLNASSQIATNPAIDQSASNKSTSSSNKFVPFRSAIKPSGANSTKNVAPISSILTSSQSTTGANSSTVNIAPMNSSQSTINHSKSENSNRPSASKAYVPYQKCDAPKTQCNSTQQGASGHQGITSQKSKSFVPFGKQNTSLASVHGGRSQTSGQLNSSKVYVPFKKVPHTLPSTTQASCYKPPPALHSASKSSQNIKKCSKPGQGITQIAPISSGQVSTSTAASVSFTTQSKTCPSKPAFTSSTSSKPSENGKGKSFVPFKKPQNVSGLGSKPNTSSSLYKPAIPSSQKPQSFTKHSNQFKPSMPRSHAISNTSMSTTPSTAASTGTNSSTSHSVSNVNPVTSKCSNNNVNLVNKGPAGRVAPATSGANLNQNRTLTVSSNATSVGTGPVASSTSVEGGQFDDSLPDEMLLSLVDMDDSWDQF
ncbi:uncharacterized protein [Amphiura filiformis]|uniref:uncharacterized protein n=1 Tax=Amphiura filiformis TaxID=82378 RepID=UPI003B212B03